MFVGVLQAQRRLADAGARLGHRQRAGSLQMLGQTDALDVFHRPGSASFAGLVGVVGGDDVRVVQTGGGVDLAAEALGRARPGQMLRSNHLEGDLPAHHAMFGQPHGAHSARPELPEQPIARVAGQLRRGSRRRQVGRRP